MITKKFIIIESQKTGKVYDYPKDIPLPMVGHEVRFKDICGFVSSIIHSFEETVVEIKISVNG